MPTRLRDDLKPGGACLGIGLALTAWGCASLVIVPVDHLVRRARGGAEWT